MEALPKAKDTIHLKEDNSRTVVVAGITINDGDCNVVHSGVLIVVLLVTMVLLVTTVFTRLFLAFIC